MDDPTSFVPLLEEVSDSSVTAPFEVVLRVVR
jgi:hypothetical protein